VGGKDLKECGESSWRREGQARASTIPTSSSSQEIYGETHSKQAERARDEEDEKKKPVIVGKFKES